MLRLFDIGWSNKIEILTGAQSFATREDAETRCSGTWHVLKPRFAEFSINFYLRPGTSLHHHDLSLLCVADMHSIFECGLDRSQPLFYFLSQEKPHWSCLLRWSLWRWWWWWWCWWWGPELEVELLQMGGGCKSLAMHRALLLYNWLAMWDCGPGRLSAF